MAQSPDPTLADEGFPLLPDQTEPPDPDEAIRLEDALVDPDLLEGEPGVAVALGRTPAIDFAQHNFVPNTAGGPLMIYGVETVRQWIEKCLRTRRGDNIACDPDFGVDALFTDLIDGDPYDESAAAEFEDIVERALTVHPAIESVEEWRMEPPGADDDAAFVSCSIVLAGDEEERLALNTTIPLGG